MSNKAAMTNTTWTGTRHMKERYHTRLLPILLYAAAILSSGLAATADPSHYTYTVSSKRATITGTTNIPVAVEARTNLTAGTWDRLLTTNIPPVGILEFSDPAAAGHSTRFYRVVAP